MGTMFLLLDRLDKVEIKPVIFLCLEQSQYEWLGLNRGQLHDGQDNTGSLQSPLYASEQYALGKEEMNPVPGLGVPDFFVSGDYYNSIQVKVLRGEYSIYTYSNGSVPYSGKIEENWPRNYGLDPTNKAFFANEILKPKIVMELKKELGL
jgi:hypothetical protein